jgi:hypothetical protein
MHVGYAAAFQHGANYPDRLFMRRELDLCPRAEELGMDSIWFTAHHFSEYSMMPDPLQGLAYVAGRTRRVELGSHLRSFVAVLEAIVQDPGGSSTTSTSRAEERGRRRASPGDVVGYYRPWV